MDGRMDVRTYGRTDVRTDGRTDGRNFSPFYRTSSPVGAAAQKGKENDLTLFTLFGLKVSQLHEPHEEEVIECRQKPGLRSRVQKLKYSISRFVTQLWAMKDEENG